MSPGRQASLLPRVLVAVSVVLLVASGWWAFRGGTDPVVDSPAPSTHDVSSRIQPKATTLAHRAIDKAVDARGSEESGSAFGLQFDVVDVDGQGLPGWAVHAVSTAREGASGAGAELSIAVSVPATAEDESILGVTDASGSLRLAVARVDEEGLYLARRPGRPEPLRFFRQSALLYRAMVVPDDAAVLLVTRARDGHPVRGALVEAQEEGELDESQQDGAGRRVDFEELFNPALAAARAQERKFPGGRESFLKTAETGPAGWCVLRGLPRTGRVEAMVSHWHHRSEGCVLQRGAVVPISLDSIQHALLRIERDDWVRLDLGLGRGWLAWRRPTLYGSDAVLAERYPDCIPIVRALPGRYAPFVANEPVSVTWLHRKEPESFNIEFQPISAGPNFVTLRPRAPAEEGVHTRLDVRIEDRGGQELVGVPVKVWGQSTPFKDEGMVAGTMLVPPGTYRVLPAEARLRRLVDDPQTYRCPAGRSTTAVVKLETNMVPIRVRLLGVPDPRSHLTIRDANGVRAFRGPCAGYEEDVLHWVPAGKLELIQGRRGQWQNSQAFDLGQVRRDQPYDIKFRVRS